MTTPYLGEIRLVPYNFVPSNWAACDGQLMLISTHSALFSLLGTRYGGNGTTTFALPDLRDRIPVGFGAGLGLTARDIGETGGSAEVTLTPPGLPVHSHSLMADPDDGDDNNPSLSHKLASSVGGRMYNLGSPVAMHATALSVAGGSTAHANEQPCLVLIFAIALQGIYPSMPG